jgi:hypothetical protein
MLALIAPVGATLTLCAHTAATKPEETHYDPDKVRRVEFVHEPPGRQHVRVTVEYVTGELKVYVVDRAVLADLLKRLDPPP